MQKNWECWEKSEHLIFPNMFFRFYSEHKMQHHYPLNHFTSPNVQTNTDPVLTMIEYENVISQLSLSIFCNNFTALFERRELVTRAERQARATLMEEKKHELHHAKTHWQNVLAYTSSDDGFL